MLAKVSLYNIVLMGIVYTHCIRQSNVSIDEYCIYVLTGKVSIDEYCIYLLVKFLLMSIVYIIILVKFLLMSIVYTHW